VLKYNSHMKLELENLKIYHVIPSLRMSLYRRHIYVESPSVTFSTEVGSGVFK
jgi:hypothetical protein